uniref:Uncharacterized protein n=1 Tax=Panagrolaimus sp. JU765 TaxID=591449 RepID=A0AC34Q4T3_9BILA
MAARMQEEIEKLPNSYYDYVHDNNVGKSFGGVFIRFYQLRDKLAGCLRQMAKVALRQKREKREKSCWDDCKECMDALEWGNPILACGTACWCFK